MVYSRAAPTERLWGNFEASPYALLVYVYAQ